MAKKTEKQIEVNRLYQQEILTVEMSDCKLGTYVEYGRNSDAMFKMCIINGQRWVQIDQFYNGMWADKLCRDGALKDGDMLHVKTLTAVGGYGGPKKRLQMHTLFRLETLLSNRDSILDAVHNGWWHHEDKYRLLFDNGMTVAIEANHVIDEERLQRSESAYKRRLQLIAENSEEKRRKDAELDEELEHHNEEPQTDDQPDEQNEEPTSEDVKALEVARIMCGIFEKLNTLAKRVETQEKIIKNQEEMIECYKKMMTSYDTIIEERNAVIDKLQRKLETLK